MYLSADEEQQPLRPGTTLTFADPTDPKAGKRGEEVDEEDVVLTGEHSGPRDEEGAEGADGDKLEKDLLLKLQMLGPGIVGYYSEAGGEKISLHWKDMQAVKVRLASHTRTIEETCVEPYDPALF